MTWAKFWRMFDQARIFPRAFLLAYGWLAYDLHEWFTHQDDVSTPQTIYISVVWGVFPLLLNFYMQNGTKWNAAPPTVTTTTVAPAPQTKTKTTTETGDDDGRP